MIIAYFRLWGMLAYYISLFSFSSENREGEIVNLYLQAVVDLLRVKSLQNTRSWMGCLSEVKT